MNGFQMRGIITGYDPFTVVLTADGKQNLIYKHAISTISPLKPLELLEEEEPT
jgi:host factor-I protein